MDTYHWGHSRRFNAFSQYIKKKFGGRVQKVTIDAGFTCPNRDGAVGRGGCTYCNNDAFNPSYCNPTKSILQQIEEGIEFHGARYRRANNFMAYFQAYTNTYKPLEELKKIYSPAFEQKNIVGIVIGTRPDCIDDEKLEYFKELSQSKYVILEYGIESCYDKTLELINRGHTFETTRQAIEKTTSYGIKTGGHMLFGLPGETKEMMLNQVNIINTLPLNTIKFHQLQVMTNTAMAKQYKENPDSFNFFELDEYIDFVIDFIERLNPNIVIERFSGEAPPRYVLSPSWDLRTDQVLNLIEKRLQERETWQGRLFNNKQ
ncbi:MAG: TIGR01212 family radical SAM protein [Bacteroidota bacterium]|nr:TIGR01212 family radical SAM protein [Bacteroidota bacterium]